jgi:hypothetical protein
MIDDQEPDASPLPCTSSLGCCHRSLLRGPNQAGPLRCVCADVHYRRCAQKSPLWQLGALSARGFNMIREAACSRSFSRKASPGMALATPSALLHGSRPAIAAAHHSLSSADTRKSPLPPRDTPAPDCGCGRSHGWSAVTAARQAPLCGWRRLWLRAWTTGRATCATGYCTPHETCSYPELVLAHAYIAGPASARALFGTLALRAAHRYAAVTRVVWSIG